MNVGQYSDLRLIESTNASKIYDACYNGQTNRIFVLKQYSRSDIGDVAIKNEIHITQTIEQYASRSIVVPVIGKEIDSDGKAYLVMQKKKSGIFLAELLKGTTLSLMFALRCTEEILRALATLHAFAGSDKRIGYLHLDLHPGNVFMENVDIANERAGTAKLIDFATAVRIVNGTSTERSIAAVSAFSAPELYSLENAVCTASADLYSVGAIFYSMFVGGILPGLVQSDGSTKIQGNAIQGPGCETPEKAENKVKSKCESLGLPKSVSRAVCAFIRCALDYNPVYRYQTAEEMLSAVEKVEQLLQACENLQYETIFRMEYDDFANVDDVHPETLIFDSRAFCAAAASLDKMLHADHIDAAYTKYLFTLYWKMAQLHKEELSGDVFYNILSSGIAVSNHTGDVVLGYKIEKELDEIKSKMAVPSYLDLLNRRAVQIADRYEFAQAADMQEKNICALRKIKEGYKSAGSEFGLGSDSNIRSIALARALSSLAVYKPIAYANTPKEEVYELFREAIAEFGSGYNIKITQSHMMHYQIMINDWKAFRETCVRYFDISSEDTTIPIALLIDKCVQTREKDMYGLYALVKALYVFSKSHPSESDVTADREEIPMVIDEEILVKLRELGDHVLPRQNVYNPVQTIFRYLALIEYEISGEMTERAEDYFQASISCQKEAHISLSDPLNIYMLIAYQTSAIFLKLAGDYARSESLGRMLRKHAEKCGWVSLVKALDSGKKPDEILVHEYA